MCSYSWSRYSPQPVAVLIFCTHWGRPNPINHVCECLISTLLALVSFSWLSARFIMAFGEGVCGVWVVIHCYGSMLLNVSPCWGERCPERAVNVPRGESACWYTHLFPWTCFHSVFPLGSCVRHACTCYCVYWWVSPSVYMCLCLCVALYVHTRVKKLHQVMVACVPVCYHGDNKWSSMNRPSGWWNQITSMKGKSRNKHKAKQGNECREGEGRSKGEWGWLTWRECTNPYIHIHVAVTMNINTPQI